MLRLIVNYYKDKNQARQKELDYCLRTNVDAAWFTEIVVLAEEKLPITSAKVVSVSADPDSRPTFAQLFDCCRLRSAEDDINVVANSDIFFDSSVSRLNLAADDFYALARWDVCDNVAKLWLVDYAQDAWAFRGKPRDIFCKFSLGYPGCDNRLAFEAQRAGYVVHNPAFTFHALHMHESAVRNYPANMADGMCLARETGLYLFVQPSAVNAKPKYRYRYGDISGARYLRCIAQHSSKI